MESPKYIVIKKNKFVIKFSANNFDTWICNSKGCNASFITSNSGKLTVLSALHCHEDGANDVGSVSQSCQMKKNKTPSTARAAALELKRFKSNVRRHLTKLNNITPEEPSAIVERVKTLFLSTAHREDFLLASEKINDTCFIVFSCKRNLFALCQSDVLFCDILGVVVPNGFGQLHVFKVFINYSYVPVAFVLLSSNCTIHTHLSVLFTIARTCCEMCALFRPKRVILPLDQDVISAYKHFFTGTIISVCHNQWKRSVLREMKAQNLIRNEDNYTEHENWLRLFFTLPLIPADQVSDAFAEVIMANPPNNSNSTTKLCDYILSTYIKPKSDDESYTDSVCYSPNTWAGLAENYETEILMTGAYDLFCNRLYRPYRKHLRDIKSLATTLLELQRNVYLHLDSTNSTHTLRSKSESTLKLSPQRNQTNLLITEHYRRFRSGQLSRKDFMHLVSFLVMPNLSDDNLSF